LRIRQNTRLDPRPALEDAEKVTKALRKIFEDIDLKKLSTSKTSALKIFAALGVGRIEKFIRNSKNWRINRYLVMVAFIYLVDEAAEERLDLTDDSQFTSLLTNLFSDNISNYNGAVFQIVQTAYFHAKHQASPSVSPRVAGIDVKRGAYYLVGGETSGNPYRRQVDILLEYADGTEEWVELKSYSNKTITDNIRIKANVFNGSNPMREFFHDYRLNEAFLTADLKNRAQILRVDSATTKTNKKFTWYFQDFNTPKGANNNKAAPNEKQVDDARIKLCKNPKNVQPTDYQYNFKHNQATVAKDCKDTANTQVTLRNTKSYFTEVLDLIGSEFAQTVKEELLGVD
jgi:hypothetical protein